MNPIQASPRLRTELESLRSKFPQPIPFPWSNLPDIIRGQNRQTLPIVGYGSLLNQASAARTLANVSRAPCIAFGCRRVFNYDMPEAALNRLGTNLPTRFRAALNVEITGNIEHSINGVITELHSRDIEAFRQREKGYDLVPVSCIEWDVAARSAPSIVFVLAAPDCAINPDWQVVRPDILPHLDYLRLCEAGAESFSTEFLEIFRKTTFLADKQTPISTWQPHDV